jgi:hypothetical protein
MLEKHGLYRDRIYGCEIYIREILNVCMYSENMIAIIDVVDKRDGSIILVAEPMVIALDSIANLELIGVIEARCEDSL